MNLSKGKSIVIRQTVEEYIKERYGGNMGYEKICPICKAHLDADEKCDCIEKRKQAVQILREKLVDGATCRMNLETLDRVYFENVNVCMGENDTLEVVSGVEPKTTWVTLDLDKIVDVEIVNKE
jgi:DNA repair exonuclease SbcCD ATPase subunit